jgi:hypothetical protein
MAALYAKNTETGAFELVDHTEHIDNEQNPDFVKTLSVEHWSLQDRELRVAVFEEDSDELTEKHLIGEAQFRLSEFVAVRSEPLLLSLSRDGKPMGEALLINPDAVEPVHPVVAFATGAARAKLFAADVSAMVEDDAVALVGECGGDAERAIQHLNMFAAHGRKFGGVEELFEATRDAETSMCHAAQDQRSTLQQYLESDESKLLRDANEPNLGGGLIDMALIEGGGIETVLLHLRKFDQLGRRFQTAALLV